jgi:hypothetical protein
MAPAGASLGERAMFERLSFSDSDHHERCTSLTSNK